MARWQDYEEKNEKVWENDELLISSWWIVKRLKALQFKGDRGEKWETGAVWPIWLKWEKWDRGEPFKYENFTESQLENLKGPKWDIWETWPVWPKWEKWDRGEKWEQGEPWRDGTGIWDLLSVNNLSDLSNRETARQNLEVYSKSEVEEKLTNIDLSSKVDKEEWKVLSDNNFSNEQKEKLQNLQNFSWDYNDLTNKPSILSSSDIRYLIKDNLKKFLFINFKDTFNDVSDVFSFQDFLPIITIEQVRTMFKYFNDNSSKYEVVESYNDSVHNNNTLTDWSGGKRWFIFHSAWYRSNANDGVTFRLKNYSETVKVTKIGWVRQPKSVTLENVNFVTIVYTENISATMIDYWDWYLASKAFYLR